MSDLMKLGWVQTLRRPPGPPGLRAVSKCDSIAVMG